MQPQLQEDIAVLREQEKLLVKLIATANDKIVKAAAAQIKGKGKVPDRSGGTQGA